MRNMSIIMLIVALLLGAVTVFAVRTVIENNRDTQLISSAPVEAISRASVVVAVIPLKFGDELTVEQLKVVDWPADIRPEGSFESINEILGEERRVALRSIGRNEPIVRSKISGFGARATLSQIIEEGHRAVTIRVNDVISVGGFVLPGDSVDILHTYQNGGEALDFITNIILEDIRVLAIDQISDESQEEAVVGKAATIEVTPEQSQIIALASRVGTLSLALRRLSNDEDDNLENSRTIKVSDLKPVGYQPTEPKKAYRRYKPRTPAPSPYGDMKITRGDTQTDEKVLKETTDTLAGSVKNTTQTIEGIFPQ